MNDIISNPYSLRPLYGFPAMSQDTQDDVTPHERLAIWLVKGAAEDYLKGGRSKHNAILFLHDETFNRFCGCYGWEHEWARQKLIENADKIPHTSFRPGRNVGREIRLPLRM